MIIGVDLGYGWVKVINGVGRSVRFPTMVSMGRKNPISASITGTGSGLDALHGRVQSEEYYFGRMAALSSSGRRIFDEVRYTHKEALALLDASVSLLLPSQSDHVVVMTGVPLKFFNEQADEFEETLRNRKTVVEWLEGPLAGQTLAWCYDDARVFPQGFAALFSQLIGPGGTILREDLLEPGLLVGVIDCGRRTTDYLIAEIVDPQEGLARTIDEYCGTLDDGAIHVEHAVAQAYADATGGIDLGNEAESAMRKGYAYFRGKRVDLTVERDKAIQSYGQTIADQVRSAWGHIYNRLAMIFLAGGGSLLYEEQLRAAFPFAEIAEDPQLANAVGFLRIGEALYGDQQSQPAPADLNDAYRSMRAVR